MFGRKLSLIALLVVALNGTAMAQSTALPVPDYPTAKDVPGAHELPDPKTTYKVVFDIGMAGKDADKVNPGLANVATFVNTLAQHGVPASHRMIAVVIHQGATPLIMTDKAFAAKYKGQHNPNVALVQALKKAGVDLRVCGQAMLGNKIAPADVQPEIEIDLWALTTLVNLETRGYVHVGG